MADPIAEAHTRKGKPLHTGDDLLLVAAVQGVKSVLEFGPGESTQIFLDAGVERVVSCEYIDKWFNVAKERFKGEPRVEILKFTDTIPVAVDGLEDEQFDVAFVDAPKGWPLQNRHIHQGYEDCSRFNTCLYALQHAPVVYLHDAYRPLERGSLCRLSRAGYEFDFIDGTKLGLARITKRELQQDRLDPPRIAEPGGIAPRAKPKRGRVRISKRASRRDVSESVGS
jgi:hypothetical protein